MGEGHMKKQTRTHADRFWDNSVSPECNEALLIGFLGVKGDPNLEIISLFITINML